ncbi:hypothetical protein VTJ04DRAFT_10837 [Mycothermus thermophilus]|uniref:uncharacterized protein n=1 Tax=Humicola insolens TaxID=85995 RepID=UPI00374421BC
MASPRVFLVDPMETAIYRVHTSLLRGNESTLVPFDCTFGGRVEPELVSGLGFARYIAALNSVSLSSWIRIYVIRWKMFLITVALYIVGYYLFIVHLWLLDLLNIIHIPRRQRVD